MTAAAAPPRDFPHAEFEQRLARAQAGMARDGLDALLLTTEPELRWFTGFLTEFWHSPTRPWFLVVPLAGKPIAVIPAIGAPLMARTWIDDIRSWESPRPDDEGISLLLATLREVGADGGRIGLPMGPETVLRMPLTDYARLRAALPRTEFADCTPLLRSLRQVKSEAEIACIAHACRVAADAFDALPEIAHAGQPLVETFRAFRIELLRRGADAVPFLVGAAAPGGYGDVISPPDRRPLQAGDVLMLDTGAQYAGYFCDFDRNFAIGHADEASRRAHDTLYRATEDGLAAARPGATCAELFHAMQRTIAADGYPAGNTGRLGHGLGLQLTEWPSHTADDDTVLEPGMVLTLEPGLAIAPGRTLVHEEDIVIRPHGPELLSRRAPAELPLIG